VFQKSHCDYGTNQAISTTSGFTLLLHNQRLKPDKEKPDHRVGRPGRRASIVGQGEAGFYRPAMNQSPKLSAVPAKPRR
jgi:hypothetical protein